MVYEDVPTGSPDGLMANTAAPALQASFHDSATLNGQAARRVPVGPIFAEGLTAGYRVDVWDDHTDDWRSLCRRTATYRFLDPPAVGRTVVATNRDGLVERSAVKDPKKGLLMAADLLTWDGWSLCVRRPGLVLDPAGAIGPSGQQPGGAPPPPPVHLDIATKVTPGSLPRLRFGRWYRMRARAVDLAGNSVALEDPPKDTPEATASLRYGRLSRWPRRSSSCATCRRRASPSTTSSSPPARRRRAPPPSATSCRPRSPS